MGRGADIDMIDFAELIEDFRLDQRRRHFASFGREVPQPRPVPTRREVGSRLPRRPAGNGIPSYMAVAWLGLCEILCRSADDFDHETRRGWVIACRLLGLGWHDVREALRDVRDFGPAAAALAWAPFMGEPDERFIGKVYLASVPSRGEIIKVGFSTDPARRMTELSRTQHAPVRLLSARAGTMLHEWALHHLIRHPVEPEWYPVGELPAFLLVREAA